MTAIRPTLVLACVGLLIVTAPAPASAQQFIATGRDTLRQLPGVELLVEPLEPEFERAGLTAAALKQTVDARLRAAGILVYDSQMANPSVAKPFLYVQVSGLTVEQQGFALALQVQLRQTLRSPVTDSNVVNAMTWERQTVVFVPEKDARAVVPEVETLVAAFVQDWRAAHEPRGNVK